MHCLAGVVQKNLCLEVKISLTMLPFFQESHIFFTLLACRCGVFLCTTMHIMSKIRSQQMIYTLFLQSTNDGLLSELICRKNPFIGSFLWFVACQTKFLVSPSFFHHLAKGVQSAIVKGKLFWVCDVFRAFGVAVFIKSENSLYISLLFLFSFPFLYFLSIFLLMFSQIPALFSFLSRWLS